MTRSAAKRRVLQAAGVAGLVAVGLILRRRDRLPETPEAAVTAFFDAADVGDDDTYLRLTAPMLRATLANTRSEMGVEPFRSELRRSVAGIKGLAVSRGSDAPPGQVALEVEIVFADRNERHRMLLRQEQAGWLITSIAPATTVTPAIRYGTPVFEETEQPPEEPPIAPE